MHFPSVDVDWCFAPAAVYVGVLSLIARAFEQRVHTGCWPGQMLVHLCSTSGPSFWICEVSSWTLFVGIFPRCKRCICSMLHWNQSVTQSSDSSRHFAFLGLCKTFLHVSTCQTMGVIFFPLVLELPIQPHLWLQHRKQKLQSKCSLFNLCSVTLQHKCFSLQTAGWFQQSFFLNRMMKFLLWVLILFMHNYLL